MYSLLRVFMSQYSDKVDFISMSEVQMRTEWELCALDKLE